MIRVSNERAHLDKQMYSTLMKLNIHPVVDADGKSSVFDRMNASEKPHEV